jgi:hypothetical protein
MSRPLKNKTSISRKCRNEMKRITVTANVQGAIKEFKIYPKHIAMTTIEMVDDGTGVCGPDGATIPHPKLMLHLSTGVGLIIEQTEEEYEELLNA